MDNKKLLLTGIIGTVIAALCCFTPVLVFLLGVLGMSALVGYLDYVLLPALAFFLVLTFFVLYRIWTIQRSQNSRDQGKGN